MRYIILFLLILIIAEAKTLIFYCGITMRKPMQEIAKKFEKIYKTQIKIIPGGSKSLLLTIKKNKNADLYLPGSEGYILSNKDMFIEYKYVGFNKLSLVVKKGNPKQIKSLNDLQKDNIKVVLCNHKLSSCGKEAKKVLSKKNMFWEIFDKSIDIALDSRPLNQMVKKYADAGLNWQATISWENNSKYLASIPIKEAKKHNLLLAVTKCSKNKKEALKFMNFAYKEQKIMKKYGFR